MKIGLFGHQLRGEKFEVFRILTQKLNTEGIEWLYGPDVLHEDVTFSEEEKQVDYTYMRGVDFVFTLGGDGTILAAMTYIGDAEIPVVGVNLGRMGFLAGIDADQIGATIEVLQKKRFTIRERSMLTLESNLPLFAKAPFALNDFTLHKRDTSSMITINTYVDGEFLAAYWADGLIVSTPTGSTGYSLSCGGPIIMPGSGNIVITPVAPHNLNVRPMVLSDCSRITFEIQGRAETYMAALDSRYEVITKEHRLAIRKCEFSARLVHPDDFSYLSNIRKKLQWAVDRRN